MPCVDCVGLAEIGGDCERASARVVRNRIRGALNRVPIARRHRHQRALGRQRARDRVAESLARTTDHRNLVLQS